MDYAPYLAGDMWPSESKADDNVFDHLIPVQDMAPQHAVSALWKLMRNQTEFVTTEAQEEESRAYARSSVLGKALISRALGINDLSPDDTDALTVWLDDQQLARTLATGLLQSLELAPMQAAQLAMELANWLSTNNYRFTKEF